MIVFDPTTWAPCHETDGLAGALALTAHPSGRAVYVADGKAELVSIAVPGWEVLGRQPSGGAHPCAIALHPSGRFAVTRFSTSACRLSTRTASTPPGRSHPAIRDT